MKLREVSPKFLGASVESPQLGDWVVSVIHPLIRCFVTPTSALIRLSARNHLIGLMCWYDGRIATTLPE